MNTTNVLQIKVAAILQVLYRSIIAINNKHYNRLSSKLMHTQINILNM
jgi:hypothetical protein